MPGVAVLLRKMDEGVAEVGAHYQADLASHVLSDELLYAILQVVRDARSAFEWTATAIKNKYVPGGKWTPYFPFIADATKFADEIENRMTGLTAASPRIVVAIERHQPFQPGYAELGYLPELQKVNNHRDFTAQTRTETPQVEVRTAGAGAIRWSGNIRFAGNVSIQGVPIDPLTQLPVPHPSQTVTKTVYVHWRFEDLDVPVLPTLLAIAQQTRAAVEDIRQAGGL